MPRGYLFVTPAGPFTIVEQDGLFVPYFQGIALGSYISPQYAADDLTDGQTKPHPSGIDTSTLGIPHDLRDWEFFEESEQTH